MEQAVKIMRPLANATDVVQADSASVATVLKEFQKFPSHFQQCAAEHPQLAAFCGKALVCNASICAAFHFPFLKAICDSRWLKNFQSPVTAGLDLLDPKQDQAAWDDSHRQNAAKFVLGQFRQDDQAAVQIQLGSFILREGVFRCS
jgi:hypothetical protein